MDLTINSVSAVDHKRRGAVKVLDHLGARRFGDSYLIDGGDHVGVPRVALSFPDSKWGMAHPQAWVPTLGFIPSRAAPILSQKQELVFPAFAQVRREDRPQHRVFLDARIKRIDQTAEGGVAADLVIQCFRFFVKD